MVSSDPRVEDRCDEEESDHESPLMLKPYKKQVADERDDDSSSSNSDDIDATRRIEDLRHKLQMLRRGQVTDEQRSDSSDLGTVRRDRELSSVQADEQDAHSDSDSSVHRGDSDSEYTVYRGGALPADEQESDNLDLSSRLRHLIRFRRLHELESAR